MPARPLVLLGATATGKSALALALAERLPIEIVNADALQVYRGFDLGTAKQDAQERARVPHHLIDILEPHERYSAGEFARRAHDAIAAIAARGRLPVVVGGSGLYLRALLSGLSPIPPGDPAVRAALRERLAVEGLASLRAELDDLDPETAGRLTPGDTQRILRALEVRLVSGLPLSAWIARKPFGIQSIAAISVGLTLPRAILYDRIADRVSRMVKGGWVAEVEKLLEQGLDPTLPPFQAIGYRQLVRHVRGEWSLEQAIEETIRATRRFAKRQETWFRKEPDVAWLSAEDLHRVVPHVLELVELSGRGEGL
jgi:tRNA dimethylallyltransferase